MFDFWPHQLDGIEQQIVTRTPHLYVGRCDAIGKLNRNNNSSRPVVYRYNLVA
jgi:hypothetical protein